MNEEISTAAATTSYTKELTAVKAALIEISAAIKKGFTEGITKMPQRPGSSVVSNVSAISNAAFTVLAAANRMGFMIFNSSGQVLYCKFGNNASSTDYSFSLADGQSYESPADPVYCGVITGRLGAGSGTIRATEHIQ